MKKSVIIWLGGFALFWLSLLVAFLVDYLGIVETSNLGFVETVWITWMLWTVVLGFATSILIRFVAKE